MRHKEHGIVWTARAWGSHYQKDVAIVRKGEWTKICTSPESARLAAEAGWKLVSAFKYGKRRQLLQQRTPR